MRRLLHAAFLILSLFISKETTGQTLLWSDKFNQTSLDAEKWTREVGGSEGRSQLRKVLRFIANEITLENNWEQFELHFNQIHQNFLIRLRQEFPDLTHTTISS